MNTITDNVSKSPSLVSDDMLIILPMRYVVLFPGTVFPAGIQRELSIAAAQEAARTTNQIGFLLQRDPDVHQPGSDDLHKIGTAANILRYVTTDDGRHHLVVQGERRFRVLDFQPGLPFMLARVEYLPEFLF